MPHPAPVIELALLLAGGWFCRPSGASADHALGIWLLVMALVFATGVALIYDRPALRRH